MLEIIEQWTALSLSKIEGLEPINVAFRTMITQARCFFRFFVLDGTSCLFCCRSRSDRMMY